MKKAIWNKRVIAESDQTIELEGNVYFPLGSIEPQYFELSPKETKSPWLGAANYYHLTIDGKRLENVAWYYPNPKLEGRHIRNFVAFAEPIEVIENS